MMDVDLIIEEIQRQIKELESDAEDLIQEYGNEEGGNEKLYAVQILSELINWLKKL